MHCQSNQSCDLAYRIHFACLLAAILGSGCGTSGPRLSDAEKQTQEQAMAMVDTLGGEYRANQDHADAPLRLVHLANTAVQDDDLAKLVGLSYLENLNLQATGISDNGLVPLAALTSLVELNLSNTKITDAGLEHLQGLSNLKGLYLRYTPVSEQGINKIKQALPELNVMTRGF